VADFHTGKDHLFANGNDNDLRGMKGNDVVTAIGTNNRLAARAAASGERRASRREGRRLVAQRVTTTRVPSGAGQLRRRRVRRYFGRKRPPQILRYEARPVGRQRGASSAESEFGDASSTRVEGRPRRLASSKNEPTRGSRATQVPGPARRSTSRSAFDASLVSELVLQRSSTGSES